jgi:ABC-type transporter Mla subunit MlaD
MTPKRKLLHESGRGHILVGLFVLAAIIGFTWLLVTQRRGPERYVIVAEFDTLGNINESTKVKLRGFTIGQVRGVEFRPVVDEGEAHFLVQLGIEKKYPVPVGTVAEIRGSGLVGEAYVHLNVSEEARGSLTSGSRIVGRADPGMASLMTKIKDAAQKLGSAGQSLSQADLGGKLGGLGADVSRMADDLGRVSHSADSLLLMSRDIMTDMEPGILRTLGGLDASMTRLSTTLGRADTLVASTSEDVRSSVRSLRLMVERLERVLERVDTLVQQKELEIDETITNLNAASVAVREISEHPWKLVTGQGKKDEAGVEK